MTITTSDPSVGNQDIVDLPGVVAEDKNDPTCSAIRDMIHNILVSCGPQDTVILFSRLNVDGNERNNSSIAGMIPEGMEPVVVLTGADEFDEENAEHFLFEEVRKHMLFMFGSERVLDQGGRLRQEWHPFVVGLPCKKDMRGVDADFRSFRHRWNEVVDGKRRELLDAVRSPDKRDGPLERYDINELEKHIIQRHLSSTRRALSGVPRLLEECARRELGDKLHALSVSLQALENNNLRSVLQDAISDIYDVIHRAVRGKDVWHGRCTIPSRSFQQEVEHAESSIPEEMTWPLPPQHVYLEVNGIGIESGGENPTPEGLCQSYSEQFRMATVLGATSNLGIKFRWLASEMFLRMKRVEVADPPMEVFRNLAGGLEGTNTTAFKPAVTQLLKRVCKCVFQERCCNYVHERLRALLVQLVENAVEEIRGQAKGMRAALEEQCWRVLTERLTRAVERFLGLHMQELRHQLDSRETFPSNRFQALAADLAAGGGDAQPIMNSAKEADEKFNKLEKEFDGDEEKLHRLCVDAFQTHFRLERTLCAQVVMGSVILLQDMVEGIEGKYNLLETLRLFGLEDTKEISLRGWSCLNFGTPETVLQTEPLTTDALERVYGWKGGLEDMRRESHRLLRIDEVTRMGVSALRRGIQELRINEDHET